MNNKLSNVFLIGPMGAGKTTVARQLARLLDMTFIDSDHEIQKQTGVDIPLIFEYEGEAGFRSRESSTINRLTQRSGIVMSTGGGAILENQNRDYLKSRGIVVYLKASLAVLTQRTCKDPNRPLLQSGNVEEKIRLLMQQREPLYQDTADLIFDTTREHSYSLSKRICAAINTLKRDQQKHDTHTT